MMDKPFLRALMQNARKTTARKRARSLFRLNWLVGAWLYKYNSSSSEACKYAILKCDFHRDFSTYNAICGTKKKPRFIFRSDKANYRKRKNMYANLPNVGKMVPIYDILFQDIDWSADQFGLRGETQQGVKLLFFSVLAKDGLRTNKRSRWTPRKSASISEVRCKKNTIDSCLNWQYWRFKRASTCCTDIEKSNSRRRRWARLHLCVSAPT